MSQDANAPAFDAPQEQHPLTIIVGTGRCGSTMLSNLLREHPAVLSLSEFFALLEGPKFSEEVLDASQFWTLIGIPGRQINAMLRRGIQIAEFLYPITAASRFNLETGIPPILLVTLPHLTGNYEDVFDELREAVSHFPPDRVEHHYMRLFAWLKQRFKRQVCVERSGLSLPMLPSFMRLFPEAKFVHIIRDGRECAFSMSRHVGFHLAALAGAAKIAGERPPEQQPSPQAATTQAMPREIPIEVFGNFWSNLLIEGVRQLAKLPQERVLTVTYEEFIAQPQASANRLITFIDPTLHSEAWTKEVATQVRGQPFTWTNLPPQQRQALEAACQPGLTLLEIVKQEGSHSKRVADFL